MSWVLDLVFQLGFRPSGRCNVECSATWTMCLWRCCCAGNVVGVVFGRAGDLTGDVYTTHSVIGIAAGELDIWVIPIPEGQNYL